MTYFRAHILVIFIFLNSALKSQSFSCNQSSATINTTFYSNISDSIRSTTNLFGQYLCGPNTIISDTNGTQFIFNRERFVYLNSGSTYIAKLPITSAAHFFYVKDNATLIINLNAEYSRIYYEPLANIIYTGNPPMTFSCTSLTFPTINCAVGINDLESSYFNTELYPQPTKDVVNINLINSYNKNIEIKITDITGKEIEKKELDVTQSKTHFSTLHLPNGIYILQLKNSQGQVATKRLVVSK